MPTGLLASPCPFPVTVMTVGQAGAAWIVRQR